MMAVNTDVLDELFGFFLGRCYTFQHNFNLVCTKLEKIRSKVDGLGERRSSASMCQSINALENHHLLSFEPVEHHFAAADCDSEVQAHEQSLYEEADQG